MPQAFTALLKTLTFTEPDREGVQLSDPDRIRLDPEAHCVKLRAGPSGYTSDGTVYVTSKLVSPNALRRFTGFQATEKHTGLPSAPLTSVFYRLTDGTLMYWFNGTEWAQPSSTSDWNTAEEVSAAIGDFAQGIAAKRFAVAANLRTSDPSATPELHAVKVGIEVKVHSALEDILYRGLAPALRSGVRAVTDMVYKMPAQSQTVDMGAVLAAVKIPFRVVDLDSVFNRDAGGGELEDDILQAYNPGTKIATLVEELPVNTQLHIQAVYEPTVAVEATSPDFIELAQVPALLVSGPELLEATPLPVNDSLLVDRSSGATLEYLAPLRGDLRFDMDISTPGGVDLKRLVEAVIEWAAASPALRAPGVDERYRLRMLDEFRSTARSSSNGVVAARASFLIEDVLVFRRSARERQAVIQVFPIYKAEG